MKYNVGALVQINSKTSRNNGAIGTVIGYCNGEYNNIVRVKLNNRKVINIFDTNIQEIITGVEK